MDRINFDMTYDIKIDGNLIIKKGIPINISENKKNKRDNIPSNIPSNIEDVENLQYITE